MTADENDAINQFGAHLESFKASFWRRVALMFGGLAVTLGGAILTIGIWVGTMQETVERQSAFDQSVSDHGTRLAVLENFVERADGAVSVLPSIQATLEAVRSDVAELKADVRRANENRRTP